jgi:hypothetical protein
VLREKRVIGGVNSDGYVDRRFGGTCLLHLQGRKISQAKNQRAADSSEGGSACCLLHAGFFVGLFFDPEDGGDMFLRDADWF